MMIALTGFSILLIGAWIALGTPSSIAEVRFQHRLAKAVAQPTTSLNLSSLMPGDWELVCGAHCYDGPLVVSKYNRTFPAVSACQDGAWGLVFISSDGSCTSAAGDCRSSSIHIGLDRCLPRSGATVRRDSEQRSCPSFRSYDGYFGSSGRVSAWVAWL